MVGFNRMNEYQKAKAWRERLGLTDKQLADLTGYSAKSIYWFERGLTPPARNAKGGNENDRQIKEWVLQRYRMACAGVEHELKTGHKFNW